MPKKGTRKNKRDAIEKACLEVFAGVGAFWQACDRFQGHDGNLYLRGNAFEVEFKKPGEKLTPAEERFVRCLGRVGRRLWVITSDVEAQWLVEVEYGRIPDRTDYLFEVPFSDAMPFEA